MDCWPETSTGPEVTINEGRPLPREDAMYRNLLLMLNLFLLSVVLAGAEDKPATAQQAKELSGMSIVGNDEAPKSLYIIPWKSSELGAETSLNTMLNERDVPVDRDVFLRQLSFYEVSNANLGASQQVVFNQQNRHGPY